MKILKIIVITSAAVLFYIYFGYYLLIRFLALFKKDPGLANDLPAPASVSVILSAYNAEGRIKERLLNLLDQKGIPEEFEILMASDGSDDGTVEQTRKIEEQAIPGRIRVFEFQKRRGKASVINDLVPLCKGEIIVFCDVRQDFEPSSISELIKSFSDATVGAVSGELKFRKAGTGSATGEGVASYWSFEKALRTAESKWDSVCGCSGSIYAIRKECFVPIHTRTVLDDVAIPLLIAMKGKRILYDRAAVAWDVVADRPSLERRRKIRTLAGNLQLCVLYPQLLNPVRNKLWFQFVSHKLLRLLAPWLLLALLVASAVLAASSVLWLCLFVVQVICYLMGVLGMLYNGKGLVARALSMPAGFLSLNLYAAQALFYFLAGRSRAVW